MPALVAPGGGIAVEVTDARAAVLLARGYTEAERPAEDKPPRKAPSNK